MITKHKVDFSEKLTDKEIEMFKEASKKKIVFDDDCPELSDDELKEFKRISEQKKKQRQKQTVTLRLSYNSLQKARALGKGYTSVLSRILESALNDSETIKRFL